MANPPAHLWSITVHTPRRVNYSLLVDKSETVLDTKKRLEAIEDFGLSLEKIELIAGGFKLTDELVLKDCLVRPKKVLLAMRKLPLYDWFVEEKIDESATFELPPIIPPLPPVDLRELRLEIFETVRHWESVKDDIIDDGTPFPRTGFTIEMVNEIDDVHLDSYVELGCNRRTMGMVFIDLNKDRDRLARVILTRVMTVLQKRMADEMKNGEYLLPEELRNRLYGVPANPPALITFDIGDGAGLTETQINWNIGLAASLLAENNDRAANNNDNKTDKNNDNKTDKNHDNKTDKNNDKNNDKNEEDNATPPQAGTGDQAGEIVEPSNQNHVAVAAISEPEEGLAQGDQERKAQENDRNIEIITAKMQELRLSDGDGDGDGGAGEAREDDHAEEAPNDNADDGGEARVSD